MTTQEEKEKVLKSVGNLHNEIDMCIGNLVNSRINHDEKMEGMMISQMETLLVQSQQEFSYLYDFITDMDFDFLAKHEYHDEVGLNDYERFYFRRYFQDNIKKLEYFRKTISKTQKEGIHRGKPYVVKHFKIKGDKLYYIKLNRKKVDAYIREVKEKLDKNEKIG